jgi:hypothetical protein
MKQHILEKDYYIEKGFAWLAGPYDPAIKSHMIMLQRVLNDMVDGNIVHRTTKDEKGRYKVERTNMILAKR